MIVEPLDDPDFLARVGAETVDTVRRRLRTSPWTRRIWRWRPIWY